MTREDRTAWLGFVLTTLALLGLAWLLTGGAGCASWQQTSTKVVKGVEVGAKGTHTFLSSGPCSRARIAEEGKRCMEAKDAACPYLARCDKAYSAVLSVLAGVHASKLAILAGAEGTAQAAIQALLRMLPTLQRAVEVWR